jgi:hypothetical protein
MIHALRVTSIGVAATVLVACWPSTVFAQAPAPAPPDRPSAARWLPGVSIGIGIASVGTERIPWDRQPFVGSIRLELSRLFVVEAEWTQPMRAQTTYDTGDIGLMTLNGQTGIYGRATSKYDYHLGMKSVAVLARSRMGRVSFLGGAGLGRFTAKEESVSTRTGCTGPWVVACYSGLHTFTYDHSGTALIVVGGIDVDVLPRVQAFVSGRIGGSNAVEEAAIGVGVRTTLIPDPSRRGRVGKIAPSTPQIPGVRSGDQVWIEYEDGTEARGTFLGASASEVTIRTSGTVVSTPFTAIRTVAKRDSLIEGVLWGMAAGAGAGLYLAYFDEPRTIPAGMLIGSAVGAAIDALGSKRHVVYRKSKSVTVTPVVTPSLARVGVNVAWR